MKVAQQFQFFKELYRIANTKILVEEPRKGKSWKVLNEYKTKTHKRRHPSSQAFSNDDRQDGVGEIQVL